MGVLLSMKNIEKTYGTHKVLDKVKFSIKTSEVHALIGANGAGKSTLMKILCGELDFDGGEITFDNKKLHPREIKSVRDLGIVMIRQELCVVPALTVAQYLFLGREPINHGLIDDKKMSESALELLKPIGSDIFPDTLMGELSVAKQQLVEIAKALSFKVKLLILDEPTTALGEKETKRIFDIIRSLKAKGVSIIYISHRLDELFEISDRITVLRDGQYITTLNTYETEKLELIRLLAGHDLKTNKKIKSTVLESAPTILEVNNLSTSTLLSNVSFNLKKGEVLGLAGLMGSGRTETARAICGIDKKTNGEILINGKEVKINSPKDAVNNGICYLSEDRNGEGLIPRRSIIANTVISSLNKYQEGLKLSDKRMLDDAIEYNAKLNTKYSNPHAPVTSLSGGNMQKVIIARWLLKDCPIFIFDEPTKGIDVGAKDEIYQIISDISKNGHSVILISSETDELLTNCDRILVMWEGKISKELPINEATQEKIMYYATGGKQ